MVVGFPSEGSIWGLFFCDLWKMERYGEGSREVKKTKKKECGVFGFCSGEKRRREDRRKLWGAVIRKGCISRKF